MPCVRGGPCQPFISQLDICCLSPSGTLPDPCLITGQPVSQSVIDSSIEAASELLWAMTGRQFGLCQTRIRPCSGEEGPCPDTCFNVRDFGWGFNFPWTPVQLANGAWTNVRTCKPGNCCDICEIPLPFPTCSVDEVKIDGEVILPTQYKVLDFRDLVRVWHYGPETIEGLQMFSAVPGEYCTSPVPTSYQFGVENSPGCAPGGVYRKFGEGTAADPSSVLITYTDVVSPLQGGFGFTHPTLGLYTWPTTLVPQAVGEVRKSDILIDGDGRGHYATVTYVSGPADAGPAAINNNLNPQSLFWIVEDVTPRVVRADFFGPVKDGCWPKCQDLQQPDSELDTFSVTVTYGRPVPELVKLATAKLACELILSCVGQPCQLPQRVSQITRQGLSMTLIDPQTFLKDGFSGIYLVDQAILAYNPRKLQRSASVYSPDVAHRWRRETG